MIKKIYKPIIIAAIILYGSITSGENISTINFLNIKFLDKVVHFGMYFIFYLVLYKNVITFNQVEKSKKLKVLIFVVAYGVLMEFFQEYVSINRSFEFVDMLANTLGAISALLIFPFVRRINILYRFL